MRINKYIAQSTGLSRRKADELIAAGRVLVNNHPPTAGQRVGDDDIIMLDGELLRPNPTTTIAFHKPKGVICSKVRQDDTPTIYELLPQDLKHLKTVGRLDKDSRGLILLTNDGELAQKLTHPKYSKDKVYEVTLNRPLSSEDQKRIEDGIELEGYTSKLKLRHLRGNIWQVVMSEGRNRQIRKTFEALDYEIVDLLRTQFGEYVLGDMQEAKYKKA